MRVVTHFPAQPTPFGELNFSVYLLVRLTGSELPQLQALCPGGASAAERVHVEKQKEKSVLGKVS